MLTLNKTLTISKNILRSLETDVIVDILTVMLIKYWHRSCRQNLTSSGWFLWDIQRGFGKVREFKPPRGSSRLSCDQVDTQHFFSDQNTTRIRMHKLLSGDQGHLIVRGQNPDKLATSSSPFRVFQVVASPRYWPVPIVKHHCYDYYCNYYYYHNICISKLLHDPEIDQYLMSASICSHWVYY